MPFVTTCGARLWFTDEGDGPPVVLLHGGLLEPMDGKRFWIDPGIAEGLVAEGFRVLIPDRRLSGGRTVAPIDVHTWEIEADDVRTVLDASGVEIAHVVAGSNGVSPAIRFARRFPDHVRSLTLCWPTPPDNDPIHAMIERARSIIAEVGPVGYVDLIRRASEPEARPPLLFRHVLERGGPVAESFARLPAKEAVRRFTETERHLLAGGVLRGVFDDDVAWLGQGHFPMAVVPADPEDPYHPRAMAETLTGRIAGATLAVGTPVSPSRAFPHHRDTFLSLLIEHVNAISSTGA